MPRLQKVTDDQIWAAIEKAHQEGKDLTVREIRGRCGNEGDSGRYARLIDKYRNDNNLSVTGRVKPDRADETLTDAETKEAIQTYKRTKQRQRELLEAEFAEERAVIHKELDEAMQVRDDALAENTRLCNELENAKEEVSALNKQVATVETERDEARKTVGELQAERDQYRQDMQQAQKDLSDKSTQHEQNVAGLAERHRVELKENDKRYQAELQKLNCQISDLKHDQGNLKQQLEHTKAFRDSLESQLNEEKKSRAALAEQLLDISGKERQAASNATVAAAERDQWQGIAKRFESDNERLREHMEELQLKVEEYAGRAGKADALQARMEQLEQLMREGRSIQQAEPSPVAS